jgi:hypothetical protein
MDDNQSSGANLRDGTFSMCKFFLLPVFLSSVT